MMRRRRKPGPAPVGLGIVRRDGTVDPVSSVYQGWDDHHWWWLVVDAQLQDGDTVRVELLPADTMVGFPMWTGDVSLLAWAIDGTMVMVTPVLGEDELTIMPLSPEEE